MTTDYQDLIRRLRGEYRTPITDGLGPAGGEEPDNPNEHVRTFPTTSICREAANAIETLLKSAEPEQTQNKLQPGEADEWYDAYDGVNEVSVNTKINIFWSTDPENGWYWSVVGTETERFGPYWSSKSAYEGAINQLGLDDDAEN